MHGNRMALISTCAYIWYPRAPCLIFTCAYVWYSRASISDIHVRHVWYSRAPISDIHVRLCLISTCAYVWYPRAPCLIFTCAYVWYSRAPKSDIHVRLYLISTCAMSDIHVRLSSLYFFQYTVACLFSLLQHDDVVRVMAQADISSEEDRVSDAASEWTDLICMFASTTSCTRNPIISTGCRGSLAFNRVNKSKDMTHWSSRDTEQ